MDHVLWAKKEAQLDKSSGAMQHPEPMPDPKRIPVSESNPINHQVMSMALALRLAKSRNSPTQAAWLLGLVAVQTLRLEQSIRELESGRGTGMF